MRTLKGAKNRAIKKAKETGKEVFIGVNLAGYYYIFVGSCPSAYARVGKVLPSGEYVSE